MLQQAFDPNSADYDARTALMLAAVNGRPGIVRQLIAAGADVTAVDNFGACALLEACHRGNDEIIDLLVARGARSVCVRLIMSLQMVHGSEHVKHYQ